MRILSLALALAVGASSAAADELRLASVFSDHMVVQADQRIPLWGWGEPGAKVRAEMELNTASTFVKADGTWWLALPAARDHADAFAARTIEVTSGDETLVLDDVLAGDVWLASGQSNMEWRVENTYSAEALVQRGRVEGLRMFTAQRASVDQPAADVAGSWAVMDADTVGKFSAVGTHFALALLEDLERPIGVVHSSWGGSRIEAWMSPESLAATEAGADFQSSWGKGTAAANAEREAYTSPENVAAQPDAWKPCSLPFDMAELTGRNTGVAWIRQTIELPATGAGAPKPIALAFGTIDEADEVYLDGELVGALGDWQKPRLYDLTESHQAAVADGTAFLTARIENVYGWGGMHGDGTSIALRFDDGTSQPLTEGWSWRRGTAVRNLAANHRPSHLSNGMLVALERLPVRGFLWYQGESNAGDPAGYAELHPALIHDLRARFLPRRDGPLPFYFVQLANFLPGGAVDWPALRDAQRGTLELPRTGMAVTIDVGNPSDIHPRDKRSVGQRLARWALFDTYGKDVVPSGPLAQAAWRTAFSVEVELETFGAGLATKDGGTAVLTLEVAGPDGTYHPVSGYIDGSSLVLNVDAVPNPTHVRYAWLDDPVSANLTNTEGLPASPFELEIR
ncbi:MAG: sialate O-acetylesterase [Planctomycetota bacterium]|nr:sialate O-acetylesterase [Planctomycetota bacterium]